MTNAKERKFEFLALGFIVALGALLLENAFNVLFSINTELDLSQLTFPLISYFIIEEFLKLIVLNKKNSATQDGKTAFSNALFLGLGFALTEIFHRYFNANLPSNDLAPLLGFPLIHITTSISIGYCLYKKIPLWLTIIPPILMHLLYNFIIIYELDSFLLLIYLFILCLFIFFTYLTLKNQSKFDLPNK